MDKLSKKFKGWNRKGMQQFNVLVSAVKINEESSISKEMEIGLKSRYLKICGRSNDNARNGYTDDSDDGGDDDH